MRELHGSRGNWRFVNGSSDGDPRVCQALGRVLLVCAASLFVAILPGPPSSDRSSRLRRRSGLVRRDQEWGCAFRDAPLEGCLVVFARRGRVGAARDHDDHRPRRESALGALFSLPATRAASPSRDACPEGPTAHPASENPLVGPDFRSRSPLSEEF
jgi:hypothetical protein